METKPGSSREGGGGKGSSRQVAVELMDQPEKPHMLPVWFFIGVILTIYGVLIFATGIFEYSNVPPTILANLHAPIWWGALLVVVGVIYIERSWPRK